MVDEYLESTAAAQAAEPWGEASLFRRLLAEFTGTLLFVAVGTGAATLLSIGPLRRLGGITEVVGPDPGNQAVFGTLLQATAGDLFTVAFAFATILAVLVYALGGVSGAHFNPAVTFALAVARRFSWRDLPAYWVVQCLGAIAGALVVAGIYGNNGAEVGGQDILFGATTLADRVTIPQAILAEAFIAFVLMIAIMAIAVDPRAPKGWSGLIIGLALAAGILVTAAATGGSANFARTLGPYVVSFIYDVLGDDIGLNIPWKDLPIYAAGPLIGASAAALVYESLTGLERFSPAPSPGAATGDEEEMGTSTAPTLTEE